MRKKSKKEEKIEYKEFSLSEFVSTNPFSSLLIVLYISTVCSSIFKAFQTSDISLSAMAALSAILFIVIILLAKDKLTELVDDSPFVTFVVIIILAGIAKGQFEVL